MKKWIKGLWVALLLPSSSSWSASCEFVSSSDSVCDADWFDFAESDSELLSELDYESSIVWFSKMCEYWDFVLVASWGVDVDGSSGFMAAVNLLYKLTPRVA
jgi:hypothetical protein